MKYSHKLWTLKFITNVNISFKTKVILDLYYRDILNQLLSLSMRLQHFRIFKRGPKKHTSAYTLWLLERSGLWLSWNTQWACYQYKFDALVF